MSIYANGILLLKYSSIVFVAFFKSTNVYFSLEFINYIGGLHRLWWYRSRTRADRARVAGWHMRFYAASGYAMCACRSETCAVIRRARPVVSTCFAMLRQISVKRTAAREGEYCSCLLVQLIDKIYTNYKCKAVVGLFVLSNFWTQLIDLKFFS